MENGNSRRRKRSKSSEAKVGNPSTIYSQLDDFIERFHSGEITLTQESYMLKMQVSAGTLMGIGPSRMWRYPDILGWLIGAYQYYKDTPNLANRIQECAYHLLDIIERGRTHNVFKYPNLPRRLKMIELENCQLKEQVENLKRLNSQLAKQNKNLHKYFPDTNRDDREIGDVEK